MHHVAIRRKKMKRVTKSSRRPISVILTVLLVICAVPLFAVTDADGLPSASGWDVTTVTSYTDQNGVTTTGITLNGKASVGLTLKWPAGSTFPKGLTTESTALAETYTVYVNKALVGEDLSELSFANYQFPNQGTATPKVLALDPASLGPVGIVSGSAIGDGTLGDQVFYKFELKFNKSAAAVALWNTIGASARYIQTFLEFSLTNENIPPGNETFIRTETSSGYEDIPYVEPDPDPVPTGSALLTKSQIKNVSNVQEKFREIVPEDWRSAVGDPFYNYKAVGSQIVSDNNKSYVVFQIKINEDGLKKLHHNTVTGLSPSVFKEIVPDGLKLLTYVDPADGNTYYGFKLERKYGNPPTPYIDENGNASYYIDNNHAITDSVLFKGNGNVYNMPARFNASATNLAEKFGLTSSFTPSTTSTSGGGILGINFGNAPAGSGSKYTHDNVEYTLYVVMEPSVPIPDASDDPIWAENLVSLDRPEVGETTDSAIITLTKSAGIATFKKYIIDEQGNLSDGWVTAHPDETGAVNQPYRTIATSNTRINIPVDDFKFTDRGDVRYYTSQSAVDIRAFLGSPSPTGELGTEPTGVLMATTDAPNGYTAANNKVIATSDMFHTFDYTFRYTGVPFGTAIINSVIESNDVYTVIPLKFNLVKIDADAPAKALTGWEFTAYYAQANDSAVADLGRPLLDADTKAPVKLTDSKSFAFIVPEGYSPTEAGSWNIVFVETKQPTGYPEAGNKGLQVAAVVTSDETGTLTVAPLPGDSEVGAGGAIASNVSFIADTGIATVTAYNKPGTPPDAPDKPDKPVTPSGGPGDDTPVTPSGGPGDDYDGDDTPLNPSGGTGTATSPQTGDEAVPGIMIALIVLAIIGLLIVKRQLTKIK
jgi:hypothetical protein